ncbi:MAG: tetratricopeptide repeat protein, partial [Actinomycetota bacterium]
RKGPGWLLRSEPRAARDEELVLTTKEVRADLSVAVPVSLREHLLAEGHEPEHRQVTVAFVQFDGTDGLLDHDGPGAVARAVGDLVSAAEVAADRQGVSFLATDVAKDGGKIILVAGAPRAAGDDDERMLLAVRELIDAGLTLPLRVGINRGHVFAGDVGPWYRRTYTIMGDAVNLAARLMAAAEPGQILTTEGVIQRSRTRFSAVALPPLRVKGKAEPVNPCDVGPVVEAAARSHLDAALPLVGRERELATLLDAVEGARNGRGSLVDLVGEAGMGVSRLVSEVTARTADALIIAASCDRYGSNVPYYPFRKLLREVLGLGREDDDTVALTRLLDKTQSVAPELLPWLPLLGMVLDIDVEPTPETAALEQQFLRDRVADVTIRFLEAVLPAPSLVTLQDVQWMDEASTGLLRRLAADVETRSWLIVTTRRQAETGFVPEEGSSCIRVDVGPLSLEAAIAMLEMLTEESPLPHHEIVAAAERSGGNPLFLAELLAALQSGGGVDTLPDTVEAMITTRVDQLPPKDRSLLRYAAVLGMEFDERLLRSVVADDVAHGMTAAWERLDEFVANDGSAVLRFRNALLRDVAYEGLPFRRRQQLHARVGDTLLSRSGTTAEEHAELLALHFYFGQRFDDALRFSRLAGDRARSKYANLDAAKFFERALESARRVSNVPTIDLVDLWEALGDVRHRGGELKKAHEAYTAARRLVSGDAVREARLLLKEAQISDLVGRTSDALRWLHRGQRALEGIADLDAAMQRAQLSVWYAVIRQAQGRAGEAIKWCRRAIAEAEASGERDALAHAYYTLDWALVTQGRSEGNRYSWMALAIYEELGDLVGQATVLNNLGAWAYFEGRWPEARDLYERARSAQERAGDPVSAAYGLVNVGEILSDQGRLDEAEPLFRQSIRVFKASGYRYGLAFAESQLGRVATRSGRFGEALSLYDAAGAAFLNFGDRIAVVDTNARVAECMLLRGEAESALHTADDAVSTAEALGGVDANVPFLQRIRGLALMRLGRIDPGRAALQQSLEVGRRRKAEYEVGLTLRAMAQLALLEGGDPTEAHVESDAILDRLDVVWVPEIPGIPEIGRRDRRSGSALVGHGATE